MAGSGGFGGPQQIINGQTYAQYSPAWYAAQHAEAQRQAAAQGTAAGTTLSAASKAAGIPIGGSASSFSSGSGVGGGTGGIPPAIAPPSLTGLINAGTPQGGAPSGVPGGVPGAPGAPGTSGYAHLAPVDTSAAESASFNTAKDQVGQEATGSLSGLRSALASRGMLGSGLEERGTAAAATGAAAQLGDVSRQQAVTRADEAQKNATTNFEGDVTQRGQDFQKEEASNSLAGSLALGGYQGQITQRGQDIQAMNAAKALEIEQASLATQQRSTALAGLESALKVTAPSGMMY